VADPVRGDDPSLFDEGVLDARPITPAALAGADVIILGAPARQGGLCGEMRLFLDSLAPFQAGIRPGSGTGVAAPPSPSSRTPTPPIVAGPILKGKVGAGFTSIGGPARGAGGAESVLASIHATLLAHGMVVVGAPPSSSMAACPGATPLGAVAAEGYTEGAGVADVVPSFAPSNAAATRPPKPPPLTEAEVRIAFASGQWAAQVGRLLHDAEVDVDEEGHGGDGEDAAAAAGLCVDGFGL
jgi:hypothetical protein